MVSCFADPRVGQCPARPKDLAADRVLPVGYTVTMVSPPAGFHPATATPAQLAEYGFPPRPASSSARMAS